MSHNVGLANAYLSLLTGFVPQCGLLFHDRKFCISFVFLMLNMNNVQASNATDGKVAGPLRELGYPYCFLLASTSFPVH
jgi:hypothetical protein